MEVGDASYDDLPEGFVAALEDDLDTRQALAILHELRRSAPRAGSPGERAAIKKQLLACSSMLGICQQDPKNWFVQRFGRVGDAEEIKRLVAERDEARLAKDFARADQIRDTLVARGIVLQDGAGGTRWRPGAGAAAVDEED